MKKCYYLVNQNDDSRLQQSQDRFEESFTQNLNWQGSFGTCVETQQKLVDTLQHYDLYVYCGHGSSEKFMDRSIIEKATRMPVSLLMGCSSGKLSSTGEYDPSGFALSLLLGG